MLSTVQYGVIKGIQVKVSCNLIMSVVIDVRRYIS